MINNKIIYMVAETNNITYDSDSEREYIEKYVELNNNAIEKCKNGNFEDAISDYTKAIDICSELPHAYNNRAIAKYKSACIDFARSFGFQLNRVCLSHDMERLRMFFDLFKNVL